MGRLDRDPTRPVYVISVAASIVSVHPRTLRIYEDEGLLCPARTATNIRLYSEEDVRRIAETLTAEGYPPRRADRWHPETLRRMLARSQ